MAGMMRHHGWYLLDKQRNAVPVTAEIGSPEWHDAMVGFGAEDRHVVETSIYAGTDWLIWVSTVFLGLDHGFFGPEPLVFETMVFPKYDDLRTHPVTPGGVWPAYQAGTVPPELEPIEDQLERYSTWAEAKRGHAAITESVLDWLRLQGYEIRNVETNERPDEVEEPE